MINRKYAVLQWRRILQWLIIMHFGRYFPAYIISYLTITQKVYKLNPRPHPTTAFGMYICYIFGVFRRSPAVSCGKVDSRALEGKPSMPKVCLFGRNSLQT